MISYVLRPIVPGALHTGMLATLEALPNAQFAELVNGYMLHFRDYWALEVQEHIVFVGEPTSATLTVTATTTTSTTTVPAFCVGVPVLANAGDVSHCADIPNGASCEPTCKAGYEMEGRITCESGRFSVPGDCLPKAARSRVTKAVQMTVSLGSLLGEADGSEGALSMEWAEKNRGRFITAAARSLGVPPGQVLVAFLRRKGGSARRLDGGARRMEAEVLEMRVTVLLEGDEAGADLSAVSEEYQQRLGSGSADGFLQALGAELQSVGLALPEGLGVSVAGPPTVISDFVVAVSEWLFGSWEACSAVCGGGSQRRQVECSSGDELPCLRDFGERPLGEQACEDFSGCPFEITCPFGQGSDMDCSAQAGVALGVAAVLSASCLALLCRRLQLARRPHLKGTVTLPDTSFGTTSGLKASYSIHRPDDLPRKASASSMRSAAVETCASAESMEEDGKTHVVWDTDAHALKAMFACRGTQLSFTARTSEKSQGRAGMPRIASAARADLETAFGARASGSDEDLEARLDEVAAFVEDLGADLEEANPWAAVRLVGAGGRELLPAYQDGERVEYYSRSLDRWLAARVSVAVNPTGAVRYDAVVTATSQVRVDVSLGDLRRPLRRGEAVELFSRRSGAWAPATISVKQPPEATNFGYSLELPEGETREGVPATKLRRRYAVGIEVKAYRGCVAGWASGRVTAVREGDGVDDETEAEGEAGGVAGAAATGRAAEHVVFVDFGLGAETVEWFPAHLIR